LSLSHLSFPLTPIKIYSSIDVDKHIILKENKNKSGIYLFTCNESNKQYVGSAAPLSRLLSNYFFISYIKTQLKKGKSHIYSAILKQGLSNFSLSILEYCEAEQCIEREKYYIKLLDPAYNIIKDPTLPPMTGRLHSPESIAKISAANKGINKGRILSDEIRKKMSDAHIGKARSKGAGRPVQKIEVFDQDTKLSTTYDSMRAAARALKIKPSTISKYFSRNQQKPYRGRYILRKF
jgi:group I intron endonuclease